MDDLASTRLLGVAHIDGRVGHPGETIAGMEGFGTFGGRVDLNSVMLTGMGQTLYRLMRLELIPEKDLNGVLAALRGST